MSGKITEQIIEEIRARIDIVEFIGARMTLKKAGGIFKGCCPFHREKTPSFTVSPARQSYHCFGCGEHGDVFKFLMKNDGLAFGDAVRALADRVGVVISQEVDYHAQSRNLLYAIHTELAAFYQRCLAQMREAEVARHYLASRKLSDDVVASFGIGYAPERPRDALLQWAAKHGYTAEQLVTAGILTPPTKQERPDDYYDRFRGRLMFPICDRQGRVVAFSARLLKERKNTGKYVNSPETDIFTKSRILYALDKAAAKIVKHPRREAIICEGQIDVIRCHAAGFETAVASQGTAFTKEHVVLLKKHADSVVLAFDGDGAGRKAALRTGALFLEEEVPVRVALLPQGDDPDSLIRDKGPDLFRSLLDDAVSITAFQVGALRQEERSPESIDALNRVTRAVLETLAGCPGAVLRARLLQEASSLLHVPLSALEDDLEKTREALSQRAAQAAAYREPPAAARAAPAARTSADTEDAPPPSDELAPETDEDTVPETPAPEPPSRTELLFSEFLVEHEHDAEVLDLVERHLPLDVLHHPFSRAVTEALLVQRREGSDRLAALCQSAEPAWRPLLDGLLANKQKMLSAREITSREAAQDFITALWVARFTRERGQLDASSSPDNDRRRIALSCLIKSLKTQPWEKALTLMTGAYSQPSVRPAALPGAPLSEQADAAAAVPYGHAAGSAYGAADPEEFPPSEYPPDEM